MDGIIVRGLVAAGLCLSLAGCTAAGGAAGIAPTAAALADSRWRVAAVAGEGGGMADVPAGLRIDLAFDAAVGSASGSAGCNRYRTSASVGEGRLAFGAVAASKRMCAEPPGVMAVEARFLAALAAVARASIDGDRMDLLADDGAAVLALVRAAD
jgi:heat shock protein HslJ